MVDERLDYDLIAALADAPGVGSVVLVGPDDQGRSGALPRRPNLHYLGQKSYADLPAYLKGFDVCLMPWALNEATRTISPTKTLEYMAGGKPIVSTAVADVVRDHGDLVFVAEDRDQFIELCSTALRAIRRRTAPRPAGGAAEENGWDATAEAMRRLISEPLGGAAPGGPGRDAGRAARTADDARNLIVGGGPGRPERRAAPGRPRFHPRRQATPAPGGLCRSIIQDGFTFDHAGHIFFTTDEYVDGLFRDVLADNFHEQQRESWVYLYDAYQRYPFQGNLYGLPPEVIKECLLGVIEASHRPGSARERSRGTATVTPRPRPTSWSGASRHSAKASPGTSVPVMEDTLVDPLPATEPADLSELVRQLCREVLELRQEVADLRRENAELRQQVGYWKAMHARAVQRAEHLEAEVEQLRGENRKLQDQLFGRKSEKSSSRDRSNRLEGEETMMTPPRRPSGASGRIGPARRRRDYSHLPVVEELRELPEDRRVCPQCGAALSPSDTEDSEQIEIEFRAYRRRIRRRRYQRTCTCSKTVLEPSPLRRRRS